jgi:hypothetical protein
MGGLMLKQRAVYIVEINLDPVPGWGHQPEDHVRLIHDALEDRIGHYLPSVRFEREYLVNTFNVGQSVVQDDATLVEYKVKRTEDRGDRSEVSVSTVVAFA